jgi:alpha-mannosidase
MPHRDFDSGSASKFGVEQSQPLIAVPVDGRTPIQRSILSVEPDGVILTALKPSEDGRAWIVRLFNTDNRPAKAKINWRKHTPKTVWLSNFAEGQVSKVTGPVNMAGYEIVTLRIPLPERMRKEL